MNDTNANEETMILRWSYPCPTVLGEIPLTGHARIEASAGTGKTYTLEHLVVDRLIRTEAKLTQILVMTFTEKATAELKLRIRKLLTAVILNATALDTPIEADTADLWTDQADQAYWRFSDNVRRKLELTLFGFDEAPIFTIHGFCNRILREQAFFLGEPLLQERVDSKTLFREVWRDYLASPNAQTRQVQGVLASWLAAKEESSLFKLLYDAYDAKYLRFGFDPYEHLDVCKALLLDDALYAAHMTEIDRCAIRKSAREALKVEASSLRRVLSQSLDRPALLDALSHIKWLSIVKPHGQAKGADQIKHPHELSGDALIWYEAMLDAYHLIQMLKAEDYQAIHTLLPELTAQMQLRKRRDFQFDYDDLLFRLHHVLVTEQNEALASQLRAQYTFALIDEFQDTDQIQWQITETIFLSEPGSQLILIGDPKQAIYRFRGAEIETYLDAAKRLELLVGKEPTDVYLDTNYRSSQSLLAGINRVFLQTDDAPLFSGQIGYSNPVKCGRPALQLEHQDGSIEPPISLLSHRPVGSQTKVSAGPLRDHYVETVTNEILHLLSPPRMHIRHDEDNTEALKPADIMILVRTNAEAKLIETALRASNLPVAQAPSGSVFQSPEAYAVLDLLRAVSSPMSTNAWTRVLTGPFFERGYEDASKADKVRPGELKIQLEQWHTLATTGQLEQVLSEAYRLTSLELRSALYEQEDQTLLNLRAVLNYCGVEVQRRRLRLTQLVEWLESVLAGIEAGPEPFAEAPPAPENSNSIRIMTFHKSKGLEAPVVFVCGGFSGMFNELLHRSSHYGSKQIFLDKYLPKAVERDVQRAALEEDQRLLYVALTRASVKLYLPYVDTEAPLKGMYQLLNRRLRHLQAAGQLDPAHFKFEKDKHRLGSLNSNQTPVVPYPAPEILQAALSPAPLDWSEAETPITSYSKLKRHQKERADVDQLESFMTVAQATPAQLDPEVPPLIALDPVEESALSEQLSGGKEMGQVLHDCLELIDATPYLAGDKSHFLAAEEIQEIARNAVLKHQVSTDEIDTVLALVWDVLNTRFKLCDSITLPRLGTMEILKEMEFLYPYPSGRNTDQGYVRGFIDGLFVHDGRYYWLDWKSDRLDDYQETAIASHVQSHYGIQAQLYTLALTRLLRIEDKADYERRVGGLMYVYLRGVDGVSAPSNRGLFFMRPEFEATQQFESEWAHRGLYDPPELQVDSQGGELE